MSSISIPVILSGGSGTRLWPLSRELRPKQFQRLTSEHSMLQETALRLPENLAAPMVICNQEHRFMVAEQMLECDITPSAILLEPVARNTAPAVALAALQAQSQLGENDPILLILPADHIIKRTSNFHKAIAEGEKLAEEGKLVTFGIIPTAPETGYGYIRAQTAGAISSVAEFVEKPDRETAQKYMADGSYSWNSGMFMFKASVFLSELKAHNPEMLKYCELAHEAAIKDLDFIRIEAENFEKCPEDSIDYAVMEKTRNAMVIPFDAGWNDVGSWSALWEVCEKDEHGNVNRGDVIAENSRNCYFHAESKLITGVGLEDIVVVETQDAIMVAHKDHVQNIKIVAKQLKEDGRPEALNHRKVYRPWGWYDSIDRGERFQTKRIVVYPGQKLSVQMHHHRAEHWIVVKGTAKVIRGDETLILYENQSTYIPPGTVHCLENPGVIPLEMVEVQSGSYLGEDDIIRLEDRYGRK